MDHQISWRARPRPAMKGNSICPICSISHFPFCPPHPPFHENPRFFQTNHHFQFDHRPYPPPPAPPHIPPPVDNLYTADGYGDRFPTHMSPNFPSYDHTSVGVKRMRADENHVNYSNFVSEDERRLKSLIRDHGNVSTAGFPNYENNGYMHEKSVLRRKVNEIDEGEHRIMDKVPSKSNSNGEMYEFSNPCVDYMDKGPSSGLEHGLNPHDYREGKGIGSGQGYMRDIDDVDKGRIPYKANFPNSSFSVPERADMTRQSLDSQSMHYPFTGVPDETCLSNDIQRTIPGGSISMKEPHHSYPTNWHGVMQGSVNEKRSNFPLVNQKIDNQLPNSYSHNARQSFGVNVHSENGFSSPSGAQNLNKGVYPPIYSRANAGPAPHVYDVQPPLPASPPPAPPLPMESFGRPFDSSVSSVPSSSLFPISVSSSMDVQLSYASAPEAHSLAHTSHTDHPNRHTSRGVSEGFQSHQAPFKKYPGEQRTIPLRPIVSDKPKIIDGSQIFKQPHRSTRPDHMVIILRGLPGSGKSYLAKFLRDIEVENGGDAPRIHSMDDYFMTEVVDTEFSKSSGSSRGRKPVMKKVMEYCYEPEMEEAYRSSMLKAFKKTLDEGVFSFIIVDDRNLRVADFAQFWANAKRSGFEVYLLEATYKDPAGCAARNVHGFSQDDIQNMAGQWEEASAMYLRLDIKSLLNGDDLEDSGIQEVDMDMEDDDPAGGITGSEETTPHNPPAPLDKDLKSSGAGEDDKRWDEKDHPTNEVKELKRSKWSDDFDEGARRSESLQSNSSSLSGLISAYSKQRKSVHWGDKVGNMGFSIGAANKANVVSLVIGPGAGYNLKSNPLTEENLPSARKNVESQRQNIFQEQLRAERESFKAIFEKRKQRIGGLGTEEDRL